MKGVTGRFLDTDIIEAVTIAKQAAADDDVIVLDANIAKQCLLEDLPDEIILHIAPSWSVTAYVCLNTREASRSGSIQSHPLTTEG